MDQEKPKFSITLGLRYTYVISVQQELTPLNDININFLFFNWRWKNILDVCSP